MRIHAWSFFLNVSAQKRGFSWHLPMISKYALNFGGSADSLLVYVHMYTIAYFSWFQYTCILIKFHWTTGNEMTVELDNTIRIQENCIQ